MFTVDPGYTLEQDMLDGNGEVIYPRGYTFNPLDFISLPGGLVVIDATDSAQLKWFKKSEYFANNQARLLLVKGSAHELRREFKRPVFYLTDDIAEEMKLKAVPSVVVQQSNRLLVQEIFIPEKP